MNKFRRTGRTTRMLEYAILMASKKERVIVCCDSLNEMHRLSEQAFHMAGESVRVSQRTLDGLSIARTVSVDDWQVIFNIIDHYFDWAVLRPRAIDHDIIVLVDHFAIERKFRQVTTMLYKFLPCDREINVEGHEEMIRDWHV